MIEGQSQTVRGSTSDPRSWYIVQNSNMTLQKGQENVKQMSRSKQRVLCATSSFQLTVETMIEGKSQTFQ